MTRVTIAQLPVSNNIAELPGLAHDGTDELGCIEIKIAVKSLIHCCEIYV